MKIKKEYVMLTCIMVVAVVARIVKFGEPIVGTDVAAYCRLGKNLIENGSYIFGENYNMGVFFPPGYPFFVGILNLFIGDLFFSAKSVSMVASCITILISYLIKAVSFLQQSTKAVLIIILALGSITYLKYSSFDKTPYPVEHKRAGEYLKKYVSSEYEKINVMSAKPLVSFYGDAKYTTLPYANINAVINFAKLYNVDIIAIDERLLSRWEHYNELIQVHRL